MEDLYERCKNFMMKHGETLYMEGYYNGIKMTLEFLEKNDIINYEMIYTVLKELGVPEETDSDGIN